MIARIAEWVLINNGKMPKAADFLIRPYPNILDSGASTVEILGFMVARDGLRSR